MKKYVLLATTVLAVVFLVVYGYRIFIDKPGPEQTLTEFQDTFNRYDFERMLNCLESRKAEHLRDLLSLESEHFKLDSRTVMKLARLAIRALPQLSGDIFSEDDLPKLELAAQNVRQEDSHSTVQARGTLFSGGSQWSFDVSITLVLENDQWKISELERAETSSAPSGAIISLVSQRNLA